ncbi:predicted protein [Naegleria gruberi]|uniref:Predicted protein n=1 Tax=Naegleria gruberi TaxID=5762 RepID=D2VCS5_NAEGR|nr:uncharacterized protein NAEGRDRAFT_48499 [Naegleria gruberi]EFC45360.1 predicted protein [Naegleria gruberi]|eukprot:XP_002678104.1 predicted protein [Naegleria gruberi strain NEG-M]
MSKTLRKKMKLDGLFSNTPFLLCCETCFRDFAHQVKATHQCRNCGLKTCVLHSKYHVKYVPHHVVSLIEVENVNESSEEEESDSDSCKCCYEKSQTFETPRESEPPSIIRTINENLRSPIRPSSAGTSSRIYSKSPLISRASRVINEDCSRASSRLDNDAFKRAASPSSRQVNRLEKKNLEHVQKAYELKSQFEQLKSELKDWQYENSLLSDSLMYEIENVDNERLRLELECKHVFQKLRSILNDREDIVLSNIHRVSNDQKDNVMKISSLKNSLKLIITDLDSVSEDLYEEGSSTQFVLIERKLKKLNSTIEVLKYQCQVKKVNSMEKNYLKFIPHIHQLEEQIKNICQLLNGEGKIIGY